MRQARAIRAASALFALAMVCGPAAGAGEARRPSVLIHAARPSATQWSWWVDLAYLRELHGRGFEVDYTDAHSDLTWERVRRHDVLVIYVCPLERGRYYDNTPDRPPFRAEFVALVERFLAAGGGVLLMARSIHGEESFGPLIERWGARIADDRIVEDDPTRLAPMPRMGPPQRLWFTDAVLPGPVSQGVAQVWLPLTPHYSSLETMPLVLSTDWQVVLRGGPASRTIPAETGEQGAQRPEAAAAARTAAGPPDLFAVRSYGSGRLALGAVWPQYSIGQGTQWLYDRRVLDRGIGDRPSHFGRLIENTLRWLASTPGEARSVGGFVTDPARLVEPNLRPGAAEAFVGRTRRRRGVSDPPAAPRSAAERHLRGVIGAQSALGSGEGRVADWARAAREAGLDFVVFLDDLTRLGADGLARLAAECEAESDARLRLWPGYRLETNTGNRIFLFGPDVEPPPPRLLVEGRLNQQFQDPATGAFADRWPPLIDWLGHRSIAAGRVNVGYYGFSDRPTGQRVVDLRLYSMLGLRLYRDGELVEDVLDDYLRTAAGTLPPVPVAVHLLSSPARLRHAAERGTGLTLARAASLDALWDVLGYAGQHAAPDVLTTDGPVIEGWPAVRQVQTFGAEEFAAAEAWLSAPVRVTSSLGLDAVTVYDGERPLRRFLAGGAKVFETTLELSAALQRTLVVVATDLQGGRAVSGALRTWKAGGLAPVFCGDRINDCVDVPLLARGPGRFEVAVTPEIRAGETWDGGPRGARPVLRWDASHGPELLSDRGREGGRGFAATPLLELADEGVVRVRSVLDTRYDERVPVVNPWRTYGPLEGPARLMRAELTLTALERPTEGPDPTRHPAQGSRSGAAVSVFESDVTMLADQTVASLRLLSLPWYGGPYPVTLVHGRGGEALRSYELAPGKGERAGPRLATGEWVGAFGPEGTNLALYVNRGEPVSLVLRRGEGTGVAVDADLAGEKVRSGRKVHHELLGVVDPLDAASRGLTRLLEIARFLDAPGDVELVRGRGAEADGRAVAVAGLLELEVEDGAVRLRAGRPEHGPGLPLPLRVAGLNPRWSAGLYLHRGYVLGRYGEGRERYRAVGVDRAGRAWAGLFVDRAPTTEVTVGHPVVCDRDELFVQVTARDDRGRPDSWHVSVNNPTDGALRATCRSAFPLRGLDLPPVELEIAAGGVVDPRGTAGETPGEPRR